MAYALLFSAAVFLSPWIATVRAISNICGFVGEPHDPETILSNNSTSLSCIFSTRALDVVIGVNLHPRSNTSQPHSIWYHFSGNENITLIHDNATRYLGNLSVDIQTLTNLTVRLSMEMHIGIERSECVLHNQHWEKIRINTHLRREAHFLHYSLICATESHSHRGVSMLYDLSLQHVRGSSVCQDGNRTVQFLNTHLPWEGELCPLYAKALCLDAIGNVWMPRTDYRNGTPPSCVKERRIAWHRFLTYPMYRVHTPQLIPSVPYGMLLAIQVVDIATTCIIIACLIVLRRTISGHLPPQQTKTTLVFVKPNTFTIFIR
ncbi:membrane protein A25B [Aotine betaherpesvirus 1]|uniref:Membrane protein A25B n=1 Tax=Aotine betaherpesvirus 1 TaxID=50290 RepID=G8XUJ4_9BETA|nr:membrane protein A25B [Aotine betaherpesvirus 1]AEV80835.1 membrane protein A25B [Aotine betaherpesvirus 1]